jgi:hypothetical protein
VIRRIAPDAPDARPRDAARAERRAASTRPLARLATEAAIGWFWLPAIVAATVLGSITIVLWVAR